MRVGLFIGVLAALFMAACAPATSPQQAVKVTFAAGESEAKAPIYTPTPTFTATLTRTMTATATATDTPTATATNSPTATATATSTATPTETATNNPTPDLIQPTRSLLEPAAAAIQPATLEMRPTQEWSCGDYPCVDDMAGWQDRIQLIDGFHIRLVGRFPDHLQQITLGPDELIYGTVQDPVSRIGAVYRMAADGSVEPYSQPLVAPIGLAFEPGRDLLYVSARNDSNTASEIWRVLPDGALELVVGDLPCCFHFNQANGLVFGPDAYLYVGIGSLTDHGESQNPQHEAFANPQPLEASILRIHPHTGEVRVLAQGLRNPWDLAFDQDGRLYAVDQSMYSGIGDRLLAIREGGHYGFPYWRNRGCDDECPPARAVAVFEPDLVRLPDYSLPHGLTVYQGRTFPQNFQKGIFVSLWHNYDAGKRILWVDPVQASQLGPDYQALTFLIGLPQITDLTVDAEGALLIADSSYGQIWRVTYGEPAPPMATNAPAATQAVFVTATPRP